MKPKARLTREELDRQAQVIAAFMRPLHYVLLRTGRLSLNRTAKTDYPRLSELARTRDGAFAET